MQLANQAADEELDIPHPLVLFLKYDCDICNDLEKDIEKLRRRIDIRTYYVFDSRIPGKLEIRAVGCNSLDGLPTLIDDDEIVEVPSLYDPVLDEMMVGLEDINEYLEECGLL